MTFVNISPQQLDISPYLATTNVPTLEYLQVKPQKYNKDRPTLLFLHGILGDARTWLPYLTAFPEYETLALTQSGFGQESDSEIVFDTQRHAQELVAFCLTLNQQENLPHRKFKIIAWSYACHVSLLAVQIAPELFESATLYELIVPSYGMTQEHQTLFTKDITKMMSPIIKAYRRKKDTQAIDAFIAACKNSDYSLAAQSPEIQHIKRDNGLTLQKLLTQKEPTPLSAKALFDLHQKVPITILYGENSRAIFQLSSQAGMAALGQATGMIRNSDHLLPEDEPQKFIKILHEIFAKSYY